MIPNSSASGLAWTKSSYSDGGNNCVEVARDQLSGVMPVRDSKNPAGPALAVPAGAWSAFIGGVKDGAL
ncbi:DUF397 domain-containing protein [Streptomyces sp. NPDC056508]|uniref:DUF397 domain-containing protein n=1 Tax=Streptomyces sp. NPDC056508 TaxID=3345845 RepID=UPI0036C158D1